MERFALFPTPVHVLDLDGALPAAGYLVPRIVGESRSTPGVSVSNGGGTWHSTPDLARRGDPAWDAVASMILGAVRDVFGHLGGGDGALRCGIQMWATVMPPGGYAVVHDHSESHWSVALYLDAGDATDPDSGALAFLDPRRVPAVVGGATLHPSTFTVRPRTGALVVFPGWLQHYVLPYGGVRPRVCVSANVRMDPA